MAGNTFFASKKSTGQPGYFYTPRILARRITRPPSPARVAGPGVGLVIRRSLTGRRAAACPAIGVAVRSALKFWACKNNLYDNSYVIVSCPFPAVLLRHCARSVPDIF